MVVSWFGYAAKAAVREAALRGINLAAEYLLSRAKELVPVDTGHLRDSGSVHPAQADPLGSRAPVAFVVFNTRYAAAVHEGVDMHFLRVKNPNAQAKFLESPFRREQRVLQRIIATEVERALR